MKSFLTLIKEDKKFAIYLVIFILFLIWAWIRGFKLIAVIMAVLVLSAIAVNLWKNYSKNK